MRTTRDWGARAWTTVMCAGALVLGISAHAGTSAWAGQAEGQAVRAQPQEAEYVSNELLVKFAPNMTAERAEHIHQELGVEVLDRSLLGGRLHVVRVPEGRALEEVRSAYEAEPGVEYAERNPVYRVQDGETQGVEGQ